MKDAGGRGIRVLSGLLFGMLAGAAAQKQLKEWWVFYIIFGCGFGLAWLIDDFTN